MFRMPLRSLCRSKVCSKLFHYRLGILLGAAKELLQLGRQSLVSVVNRLVPMNGRSSRRLHHQVSHRGSHPLWEIAMLSTGLSICRRPVVTVPTVHEHDRSVITRVSNTSSQRLRNRSIGLLRIPFVARKETVVLSQLALFVVIRLFRFNGSIVSVRKRKPDADYTAGIVVVETNSLGHFASKHSQQ